jgi:hypothetical protein
VVRGPEAGLDIEPLPVGLRWTYLSRPGRPPTDEVLAALIARIAGRTRPGATAGARANGLVATRRERGSASPATVELQNVASWRSLACEGRLVILGFTGREIPTAKVTQGPAGSPRAVR